MKNMEEQAKKVGVVIHTSEKVVILSLSHEEKLVETEKQLTLAEP
jgi:hypothetical protein